MQLKFDKYWGYFNLLLSIVVILDPRYKKKLIEFAWAPKQIQIIIKKLFQEYVDAQKASVSSSKAADVVESTTSKSSSTTSTTSRFGNGIITATTKYNQHIRSVDLFTNKCWEIGLNISSNNPRQ
ncbi:hypothetical protein OSB04_001704 [Centaurea solstitialis]|uniref:hAT-like transposase RNase-H fold domain-containing protein n=1 Tax=Centaurea solstitialis TaxID=347529 RepID=A0AA38TRG9_9ASTR|nr:hypothetical protein OSB04_001704 [Centaurea solstitialis]